MPTKTKADTFANIAALQVTESAANTQTAAKFAFPFSIMDKMALIISRIEYMIGNLSAGFNSSADYTTIAITTNATLANIENQADPMLIDSVRYSRLDYGAAASGMLITQPYQKDLSALPSAGILVAPSPLYAMIQSVGAASAMNCWVRLYYTYIELNTDEYWQLVESRRVISS